MNISQSFQKSQAVVQQKQVKSRSPLIVKAQEGKAQPKASPKAKAKESGPPEPRKVIDRKNDQLWFATDQSLTYLDGSLPADYGFDPLGLSDPDGKEGVGFLNPTWLTYAELIHCRYAMLGAAGCIAPEILGKLGLGPNIPWFKVGVIPPVGMYEQGYWASPYALFFIELVFFHMAELRRWQDFRKPGSMGTEKSFAPLKLPFLTNALKGSGDPRYPGGPVFNILGFGKSEQELKDLKTKEVKNGRLAMIAFFGFGAQAVLTNNGPIQNIIDHISDPFNNNILTNLSKGITL